MKKNIIILIVWLLFWFCFDVLSLQGEPGDMKTHFRLYEGIREQVSTPATVTTSYYLKPYRDKDDWVIMGVSQESSYIKKAFNLADVKLLTEAEIFLKEGKNKTPFQVIVLNGRKILVQMSRIAGKIDFFGVEVFEDIKPPRSLMNSTIELIKQKSFTLGFEDSYGKIYFLSFNRAPDVPTSPTGPQMPELQNPPRLIHKVKPEYPAAAAKANVEGKVVINAVVDKEGCVVAADIIEGHPLLRTAALEAIKKWRYEPYVVNGNKKEIRITVIVNFERDKPLPALAISKLEQPTLIKRVEPIYPPEALKNNITGIVVLEVTTNTEGYIEDAIVIDGQPELNNAAITAIKQWQYKPYLENGQKRKVKFTVVVKFNYKAKQNNTKK